MKKLFYMLKVKDEKSFLKAVTAMAKRKNANLFHCYISGDIFKTATAQRVQEFDFSSFHSDKKIISFIQSAIHILRENLPQQILLFDELCNLDITPHG